MKCFELYESIEYVLWDWFLKKYTSNKNCKNKSRLWSSTYVKYKNKKCCYLIELMFQTDKICMVKEIHIYVSSVNLNTSYMYILFQTKVCNDSHNLMMLARL